MHGCRRQVLQGNPMTLCSRCSTGCPRRPICGACLSPPSGCDAWGPRGSGPYGGHTRGPYGGRTRGARLIRDPKSGQPMYEPCSPGEHNATQTTLGQLAEQGKAAQARLPFLPTCRRTVDNSSRPCPPC